MEDFHWNCFLYRKPDRHLKEYERVFPKTFLFFHGKFIFFSSSEMEPEHWGMGKKTNIAGQQGVAAIKFPPVLGWIFITLCEEPW